MPEIKPDLSEWSRCISVHWSLPVQCVLPCTHRENWHEAWHPAGIRIRYRRSMGVYRTEQMWGGTWNVLKIPPPDEASGDLFDCIRNAITEADADSPGEAASAAYSAVLPVLANLDIQVRQLTEDHARTRRATALEVAVALSALRKHEDPDRAIEILSDLLVSLGGTG